MKRFKTFLQSCCILLLATTALAVTAAPVHQNFMVLNYHDIQDNPDTQRIDDAVTLSSARLAEHFSWLKEHGFHVVSLDDIVAAHQGRQSLPDKAVLLTFDDGYLSTYTRVFPLLKLFHYPAVVAPMVKWIETPEQQTIQYGDSRIPRRHFLSWQQINDMIASGLVEIASHSYNLHHEVPGNPQGNTAAAATTLVYDPDQQRYENDRAYRQRIRQDLAKSMAVIKRRTGKSPRAVVWPYGRYNQETVAIARELGMPVTMTLDDGINSTAELSTLKRIYLRHQSPLAELVTLLHPSAGSPHQRVAHIDLDMIYDPDPLQQEKNLGRLLDRIKSLHINTVYLQAFADPDGDGNADALYFPNRHLPVRADLFSRAATQLNHRAGVKVYAWMPVLSFILPPDQAAADPGVESTGASHPVRNYQRLSPFSQRARQTIIDIYEDLARHAQFDGLLFHDDAMLTDFEDSSSAARQVYSRQWGLPENIAEIRADPVKAKRWALLKTQWLIDWTQTLADHVRTFRPRIKTARNIFAAVVLDPAAEAWFAQSYTLFLEHYDYTAIMAMPYMENAADPEQWLKTLAKRVNAIPGARDKTVFELQSIDWRSQTAIDDTTLSGQMELLQQQGILDIGYYPDNPITGHPDIQVLKPSLSRQTFPYPEP